MHEQRLILTGDGFAAELIGTHRELCDGQRGGHRLPAPALDALEKGPGECEIVRMGLKVIDEDAGIEANDRMSP